MSTSSESSMINSSLGIAVYPIQKYFDTNGITYYSNPSKGTSDGVPSNHQRIFAQNQTASDVNVTVEQARQYSWYSGSDISNTGEYKFFCDQNEDGSYKYIGIYQGYLQIYDPGTQYQTGQGFYRVVQDINGNTKYIYFANDAGDSFCWITTEAKTTEQVNDQYYRRYENDLEMYDDLNGSININSYNLIDGNYLVHQTSYNPNDPNKRYVFNVQPNQQSSSSSENSHSSNGEIVDPPIPDNPNASSISSNSNSSLTSSSSNNDGGTIISSSSSNNGSSINSSTASNSSSSSRTPMPDRYQDIVNRHTFAYVDNNSILIVEGQPSSIADYDNVKLFITGNTLCAYNFDETSTQLFEGTSKSSSISQYVAFINSNCMSCQSCIDKCNALGYNAITEGDGISVVNNDLCVGCGQCTSVCTAGAIEMVER